MELLNAELQLQSGESDVTRGLTALNRAQDYFESLAAVRRNILGTSKGTVNTSASTETTAFPTGVLRIDRLFLLDSQSRPVRRLRKLQQTGGHSDSVSWPDSLLSSSSTGEPAAYWTDGAYIYWSPLPSGTSTVRWHGFQVASDISAGGTFAYPDIVALPLAAFAVRLMKGGLDDNAQETASIAMETFRPVLDALSLFNRDGAVGLDYTEIHTS
jgi:hypothetical protein